MGPEQPTAALFEEDQPDRPDEAAFRVALEGFEGPLDLLLQLAREQKLDITRLSILALAEQYLAFIERAKRLRLEIAADYLVMAAWLAYLKSRLLIPEPEAEEGEPSGAEMAAALAFQLQRLQAMRDAGEKLTSRPRLGFEVFARGEPQRIEVASATVYAVSLYDLLKAYADTRRREEPQRLHIPAPELYSVEEAIQRLQRMLGLRAGAWMPLDSFLPPGFQSGIRRRSAIAATFAASLEMVRQGRAGIRQDQAFGPILLQGRREGQ